MEVAQDKKIKKEKRKRLPEHKLQQVLSKTATTPGKQDTTTLQIENNLTAKCKQFYGYQHDILHHKILA